MDKRFFPPCTRDVDKVERESLFLFLSIGRDGRAREPAVLRPLGSISISQFT